MLVDAFRIPAVDVAFKREFFKNEFQCFVVASLEVLRVVFFFEFKAKLFLNHGIVNFKSFLELDGRLRQEILLNFVLGKFEVETDTEQCIVGLNKL